MKKIQFVFWDSDNTLVETAVHHWNKHVEILKTLGITLDKKYRQRIYENNGSQNWAWIQQDLGLMLTEDAYLNKIDAWYFDHIKEITLRAGVLDALIHFKNKGIPQAVVSNGRRRSVMAALEAKNLTSYFDFILCKEDYEGRKPDPAAYLTALKKMEEIKNTSIDPQTCLVIEDDPLGVAAGKAAGMRVFHRPLGDNIAFSQYFIDIIKI